jgi:hypothetical protein
MELRGILLSQKEEKIELRSLVDQMRVEIHGIRYIQAQSGTFRPYWTQSGTYIQAQSGTFRPSLEHSGPIRYIQAQ